MTPNMQLTHDTRPDQHTKGLARGYHRWQLWLVAFTFLVLAGCGRGKTVDVPRPAGLPDLTGEIAYEEEAELWLLDLATMKAQQITTDGNNHWPTWSGDGRYLFYTHGTPPASSLYVIDMTGDRKPRRLAENACCATWLANRDSVAFLEPTAEGYALNRIEVDGSNRETLIAAIQGDWQSAQAAGNLVIPTTAEMAKDAMLEIIFATFIVTPSSAAPATAEGAGSYTGPLTYAMDMTGAASPYLFGQPCNVAYGADIQGGSSMLFTASIGDMCDELGGPGVMSVDIQLSIEGEDRDDGIVVLWVGEVDVNLQERFVVGVEFAESDTLANLNATNLFLLDYSTQERYPLEITGRSPAWRPIRTDAETAWLAQARAAAEVKAALLALIDDISTAPAITDLPFSASVQTGAATTSPTDPAICIGDNDSSVWYRLIPGESGRVQIDTIGSDYDTVLAVFAGEQGDLRQLACDDDSYNSASVVEVTVEAGQSYYILATSNDYSDGTLQLNVDNLFTAAEAEAIAQRTTGEVLIAAGPFQMGCDESSSQCIDTLHFIDEYGEGPLRTVTLDAYFIDLYEVTNARYYACVQVGVCTPPETGVPMWWDWGLTFGEQEYLDHPVINVSWHQAETYCAWEGKRLPTEAEWEKAARGSDDARIYPWGNIVPTCRLANVDECGRPTRAVGGYPEGVSPYGVHDLAGNVSEWTADWYDDGYHTLPSDNPQGPATGSTRVIRGTSWSSMYGDEGLKLSFRVGSAPSGYSPYLGFRCARTP